MTAAGLQSGGEKEHLRVDYCAKSSSSPRRPCSFGPAAERPFLRLQPVFAAGPNQNRLGMDGVPKGRVIAVKHRQRDAVFFLFSLPALFLHTLLWAVPLVLGVYFSFTDWDGISRSYDFVGFQNYMRIAQDMRFLGSLQTTLWYAFLLVAFTLSVSLALALVLNSRVRGSTLFRGIYFYPAILSMLTVGLIFRQIYYHLVPQFGEWAGITLFQMNLLANPDAALYAVLFVNVWQGLGIPMVLFLAGLQTIPSDLLEAATIDGASGLQKFTSIVFPFLIPVFIVTFILTFRNGLIVFDFVRAMTDGGPGRATEVIGLLIYRHGIYQNRFAYATAEAVVLFFIIAALSIILFKTLGRREVGQL